MQHLDTSGHEPLSHLQDDLIGAIRDAQQAIAALKAAEPERHEAPRAAVRDRLYALWMLLLEPLMRVAAGWSDSGPFEDLIRTRTRRDALEALAMGMFLNIIEALPLLTIDPEKNVLALMKTIARRGVSKENKDIYQRTPRKPTGKGPDVPAVSGTRDASMAPLHETARGPIGVFDGETGEQVEAVDPSSLDIEEQLLEACYNQECLEALREWIGTLSRENVLILKARWFADAPVPYKDIIQMLGAGWTAAAARKRLDRLRDAAAEWLRERGLLE